MKQSKVLPNYVTLSGSKKTAKPLKEIASKPNEVIDVTVKIRHKETIEPLLKEGTRISRKDYEKKFGASNDDIKLVKAFATKFHLTAKEIDKAGRSIILEGKVSDFESAFQVKISKCTMEGQTFRSRSETISIPADLENIIEGVFGLSNTPQAKPRFQILNTDKKIIASKAVSQNFTSNQLSKIYGFPAGFDGKGQCIAIIELGGGFKPADLKKYFTNLGLPLPVVSTVLVDGGANKPTNANSADAEVVLDIEVAGAVAPAAKIVVYFTTNTDKGFLDAITKAVHDTTNKPSVISISWGAAEVNWTAQSLNSYNQAFQAASLLGVTICVAAGDSGSSDGVTDGKVHVDFPASSPYVLACGGTTLQVNNNVIISETVWHDSSTSATGGGVSETFPLPDYQQNTAIPVSASTKFKGRGVPDVAGNADPQTGYQVLVDGQQLTIGGTSAVAPLMSGLIALINQQKKTTVGFIHPQLYANPNLCRDIIKGDNITTTTKKGYKAGKGWDACTGWGVLSGL